MRLTRAAVSRTIKALLPQTSLVKRGTGWALVRLPEWTDVATADTLDEMAAGVYRAAMAFENDTEGPPVAFEATNGAEGHPLTGES